MPSCNREKLIGFHSGFPNWGHRCPIWKWLRIIVATYPDHQLARKECQHVQKQQKTSARLMHPNTMFCGWINRLGSNRSDKGHSRDKAGLRAKFYPAAHLYFGAGKIRYLPWNPPTPAFTKAGAAPGTTAGVEPVFVGLPLPCRSPAPTMPKALRGSLDPALRPLPSVVRGLQACRLPAVRPLPSVVKGLQACRLPAVRPLPSVVKGLQACRLPALKRLKPLQCSAASSTRHSGHCPLLLKAFKPAVCQPSGHCPSVVKGVCQPSNA